jgi:hypothetical protein
VEADDGARLGELQEGGADDLFGCLARGIAYDVDETTGHGSHPTQSMALGDLSSRLDWVGR